jgi:hypothetical protein
MLAFNNNSEEQCTMNTSYTEGTHDLLECSNDITTDNMALQKANNRVTVIQLIV